MRSADFTEGLIAFGARAFDGFDLQGRSKGEDFFRAQEADRDRAPGRRILSRQPKQRRGTTMTLFRVISLASDLAAEARRAAYDRNGNPIRRKTADAVPGFPCRHCLEEIERGGEAVLFSHSPFERPGPFREIGPIFVHGRACRPPAAAASLPAIVANRTCAFRAYDEADESIGADIADAHEADGLIARLLGDPRTHYIHARTARYGCFLCRIERA